MFNLPNLITLARIVMLPILIGLLFIPQSWAIWLCFWLYVIAALTDFLDGWLARSMDKVSAFGKFLDPIADKIFVACLLVTFVAIDRVEGIWIIPVLIILVREFVVAGLREFLGPQNIQLPVTKLAKWKTTIQMLALGFLLIGPYGEEILPYTLQIGQWGLSIAAFLTVITGWTYLKAGLAHITKMG